MLKNKEVSVIIFLKFQHSFSNLSKENAISTLQSNASESQKSLVSLLKEEKNRGNAEKIKHFWIVNAIAVNASSQLIEKLSMRNDIARIEFDSKFHIIDKYSLQVSKDQIVSATSELTGINATKAWELGIDGSGVNVSVIDTGMNASHPDIAGRVIRWKDFVGSYVSPHDDNGHGTHVAGTIGGNGNGGITTGVAPNVSLFGVKAFDGNGTGYESDIISGIQWSIENKADIISMSVGSDKIWTTPYCNADNFAMASAINNAVNAGIVVVAAAGNDPTGVSSPGCIQNVIAAGAVNNYDTIASFSGRGEAMADHGVVAPGVGITSLNYLTTGYIKYSGTSMATPHVSGTSALLLHAAKKRGMILSPLQVKTILENTSVDLGSSGKDNVYGAGRIDVFEAVKGLVQYEVLVSGQIYGGPTAWRTHFRAGNYGTNETNASINFYNPGGTLINSTNTIIPGYASANYEWKDYASRITDGTALITSKEPVSVLTFQRMDTDGKLGFWEGIPLNSQSTEVFVSGLVYAPGGWRSGFKLLNVEDTAASVTIYLYNSTGKLINTITRTIAPRTSPYFDWYTYGYNVSGGSTDGTVKAVSGRRIHIIASQAAESTGKLGFWEGISLNTDSTQVFVPGLLYAPGGWRSGIKVANYNDSSASVTIYFYNASGKVANTVTRTIAPRTSPYFDWYTYGYNITYGSTDGTAVVVSNKPIKVVASQAMETQGIVDFYQAVQISGNNTAYAAYQVYDGIERSGIKVANPGNASVSATIKFYNQTGGLVNTITRTISRKTSPYYAWASYAPGVTSGSVVVEATGRIVVVASIAGEQAGKLGIFRGVDI